MHISLFLVEQLREDKQWAGSKCLFAAAQSIGADIDVYHGGRVDHIRPMTGKSCYRCNLSTKIIMLLCANKEIRVGYELSFPVII